MIDWHSAQPEQPTHDCDVLVRTSLWGDSKAKFVNNGKYFEVMHGYHAYKFRKDNWFRVDDGTNKIECWAYDNEQQEGKCTAK